MHFRRSLFLIVCLALVPAVFAGQRPSMANPSDQEMLSRYTRMEISDYRESIRQTFLLGHELVSAANNPTVEKLLEQRLQMLDKASDADIARLKSGH